MRRFLATAAFAACVCTSSGSVGAQRVNVSPLDSACASAHIRTKDPSTASVISLFFPGVGHLYAEDINRGWLVILLYSVGAGITMSGRTDTVGKIGGTLAIGSFVFGVIDAGNAARRYNERMARLRDAPQPSEAAELSARSHPVVRRLSPPTPSVVP